MRSLSALKNVIMSLAYEILLIAFGLVVPRLIIEAYGSEVNGLNSTVTQVLQILNLLQAGAVGASIFQMYKPVAEKDYYQVSRVIRSSQKYFFKIGTIFLVLVFILAPIMGFGLQSQLAVWEKVLAILILGLNGAFYFFFVSWFDILFSTHQKRFMLSVAGILEKLVYYFLVFLIIFSKSHFAWLYVATLFGTCVKVVFLYVHYRRTFKPLLVDVGADPDFKIENRGYLLCNQIATQSIDAMPTVAITAVSGLASASVYTVYHLVQNMIRMVVRTLQLSVSEIFGNLMATESKERVSHVYDLMEFIFFIVAGILCFCEAFLFLPFIYLYTDGNTMDVNYLFPALAQLIVLYDLFYCLYMPVYTLTNVCGLFKETYLQSVICAVIAVLLSLGLGLLYWPLILLGPAFYYFSSFLYRMVVAKKRVDWLKWPRLLRRTAVASGAIALSTTVSHLVYRQGYALGWLSWLGQAVLCGAVAVGVIGGYVILFERTQARSVLRYAKNLIQKKVRRKE